MTPRPNRDSLPADEDGFVEPVPSVAVDEGVEFSSPLLSPDSSLSPDISFVFTTKDEEERIGPAIDWAIEALEELGGTGEIIIRYNSTDRTPEIVKRKGANVVESPQLGYGYTYRFGFKHVRGKYIVMGDPDCTYDFRELPAFLEPVQQGEADLVLGSRCDGEIEPNAMRTLHRYTGNPLLPSS